MARDIDEIYQALIDQGWRIEYGGKHPKAYPPDRSKRPVTLPTTPGGTRGKPNLIAALRRSGCTWPPPTKSKE